MPMHGSEDQSDGAVGRRRQVRDCNYAHTSDGLRKAGELGSPVTRGFRSAELKTYSYGMQRSFDPGQEMTQLMACSGQIALGFGTVSVGSLAVRFWPFAACHAVNLLVD
jgi:hypothetical protein